VHLLAELLDNALLAADLSSPGVGGAHGQRRVVIASATSHHDRSDLRWPTPVCVGGEAPYTARHMGLFVVGRLAAEHGLVVRLRSAIAGEPNSGTTAGVFVPSELLVKAGVPDQFGGPEYGTPADAHSGIHTALALDEDHDYTDHIDQPGQEYLNGHSEVPVALLPQRNPGASGISDIPTSLAQPTPEPPEEEWPAEELWPADSMPAQTAEPSPWEIAPEPPTDHAPGPTVPPRIRRRSRVWCAGRQQRCASATTGGRAAAADTPEPGSRSRASRRILRSRGMLRTNRPRRPVPTTRSTRGCCPSGSSIPPNWPRATT
jgi:hypothetical protein